jgi:hypothetical protein
MGEARRRFDATEFRLPTLAHNRVAQNFGHLSRPSQHFFTIKEIKSFCWALIDLWQLCTTAKSASWSIWLAVLEILLKNRLRSLLTNGSSKLWIMSVALAANPAEIKNHQ